MLNFGASKPRVRGGPGPPGPPLDPHLYLRGGWVAGSSPFNVIIFLSLNSVKNI